jgi:hypothetical protein
LGAIATRVASVASRHGRALAGSRVIAVVCVSIGGFSGARIRVLECCTPIVNSVLHHMFATRFRRAVLLAAVSLALSSMTLVLVL